MKTMIRTLVLCGLLSAACTGPLPEEEHLDVAYGEDPMQTMDVNLVAGRDASTPLVVLVHGGGWMAGDKHDADFMRDGCLAKGFNVANLNYRMGRDMHYGEMMDDIGRAMDCLLAHAGEWGIRTSKIVMWGGSAGAHLALLYAYAYDDEDAVSLVITLGAPTKLDSFAEMEGAKPEDIEGLLPIVTGKPWTYDTAQLDEAYRLASPYYAPHLKPALLIHGGADDIVPVGQSRAMDRRLREAGVADSLIVLPGAGHGGENASAEDSASLERTMCEWILKYSK